VDSGQQPISSYGARVIGSRILDLRDSHPSTAPNSQINLGGYAYDGGGGAGFSNTHGEGIQDSLTWVKSKHTVKMGFQWISRRRTLSAQAGAMVFPVLAGPDGYFH